MKTIKEQTRDASVACLVLATVVIGVAVSLLTGCGQGDRGPAGPPGATVTASVPTDIQNLVDDENAYRLGLGQTELSSGLSCTLYTVTGGQFIQNDATHTPTLTGVTQVATFLYSSSFNQLNAPISDGLNVLPAALRPVYQNLFLLRCQGQVVIQNTDYYQFDLASDDGSVLYLDGARTIDNDGNHGINDVTGQKYLRRGVHTFRLDFAQTGAGNQALILKANGALIPGSVWYH